jgi:hypothetical protein
MLELPTRVLPTLSLIVEVFLNFCILQVRGAAMARSVQASGKRESQSS